MSPHLTKKILITGASRGIGYAIAHRFATLGASIVLVSQDPSRASSARSSLPKIPGSPQKHVCITGDVSDPALWESIRRNEADIDILINAAGIAQRSTLLVAATPQHVDDLLRTNLLGTTLACRAVARGMLRRKSGGCIVNISSVLGLHKSVSGTAVYAASKAGVIGLTRALAVELGPAGIRTNVIVPGYIVTEMTVAVDEDEVKRQTPLKRFGTVDEVADCAVFLVENEFINGAEIVVDGGLACT